MNIVDSQSHLGPGRIGDMIAAMDAIGITSAVIDEFWFGGARKMPTYEVSVGDRHVLRNASPTAALAAFQFPERFSYLVKVDRRDPELRNILRLARDVPPARATRIAPGLAKSELFALAAGDYDELLAAATDAGLPVFVTIPGNTAALRPIAEKFGATSFVIDHCGMPFTDAMRQGLIASGLGDELPAMGCGDKVADLDDVLRLAELPNVALKWGHSHALFGVPGYPFIGLDAWLRRALNAFGSERIMWAGDASVNLTGESWGELLFWVREKAGLAPEECANLLGGAVRRLLKWPE
jgi:L-fuconolactonase